MITLKYFFLWEFSTKLNWYVTELLFLYIVFRLLYRKLSIWISNIVIWVLCLCFILICFWAGTENTWYGSTLCFPMGLVFAQYEQGILLVMKKKHSLIFILCFFIMCIGIGLFFVNGCSFMANVVGRNLASLSFCILVIAVILKVKIGNRLTYFLGEMAYELFLIHEIFIFQSMFDMNLFYSISAFCMAIVFGYILHRLNKKVFDSGIYKRFLNEDR